MNLICSGLYSGENSRPDKGDKSKKTLFFLSNILVNTLHRNVPDLQMLQHPIQIHALLLQDQYYKNPGHFQCDTKNL